MSCLSCAYVLLPTRNPVANEIDVKDNSLFHKKEISISEPMQSECINWKDTVVFIPPVTQGVVIKVYDGDTITIASRIPIADSPMYRFSVRLLGIDCAEIKGKTAAEKEIALKARMALSSKILNRTVQLKDVSLEKYGRILANVYLDDLHLNQWMLDNEYAIAYDGGTKSRPDEWE